MHGDGVGRAVEAEEPLHVLLEPAEHRLTVCHAEQHGVGLATQDDVQIHAQLPAIGGNRRENRASPACAPVWEANRCLSLALRLWLDMAGAQARDLARGFQPLTGLR